MCCRSYGSVYKALCVVGRMAVCTRPCVCCRSYGSVYKVLCVVGRMAVFTRPRVL